MLTRRLARLARFSLNQWPFPLRFMRASTKSLEAALDPAEATRMGDPRLAARVGYWYKPASQQAQEDDAKPVRADGSSLHGGGPLRWADRTLWHGGGSSSSVTASAGLLPSRLSSSTSHASAVSLLFPRNRILLYSADGVLLPFPANEQVAQSSSPNFLTSRCASRLRLRSSPDSSTSLQFEECFGRTGSVSLASSGRTRTTTRARRTAFRTRTIEPKVRVETTTMGTRGGELKRSSSLIALGPKLLRGSCGMRCVQRPLPLLHYGSAQSSLV